MKDEIKEILDMFTKYKDDWFSAEYILKPKQCVALYDYITNLQEENEKLKETNVYCNRTDCSARIKDSKKYNSVYQEKEDYKSRNEKAIKYINDRFTYEKDTGAYYITHTFDGTNVFELLNILEGEDKDVKD